MATNEEILSEVKKLNAKLYGENGFEGDIPEIKKSVKGNAEHLDDHSKRITIVETEISLQKEAIKPSVKRTTAEISGLLVIVALAILQLGQAIGWWTL